MDPLPDRIEKGKQLTATAIADNDPVALKVCIEQFSKIGAPSDEIAAALAECPLNLFEQTGYGLKIRSQILGRDIDIGTDVSWEALEGFISHEIDQEGLKKVFEVLDLFGGRIESHNALNDLIM